ncbi:[protein-PII] uridylyltransferase, partial [Streptomyces xiaopingdaonensis]|uniref:[protein-PII] uridylyltransferase n=1 Tax=Streptomyces xiaopingdaonensis TaxID=1565415 RepID=UPI00035D7B99
GRGELSPGSDLDLLLLHDGTLDKPRLAALADRVWYPVWDLGLALDHSVRTPAQVRAVAADDLRVQLGLLDARHLAGDAQLTASTRVAVLAQWRAQAADRLPQLRELDEERARRHGDLGHLLEPDLKEARGGLRDVTALRAVAASWLADAPREGLAAAHTALLDVRDALHLATGRATDRLAQQDQPRVAADLDLADADALLRRVHESARRVSCASEVTWREIGRVLRSRTQRPALHGLLGGAGRTGPPERTPLAEGVVEHEGEAVLTRGVRPERDPVLALRAASAAAKSGLPLASASVRRLAPAVRKLPVPWPPEAREEFVTLLGAGVATVPVWEALEAEGLIPELLPDWEQVRCRPQHNPVHLFTVDRHLVETAVRASALTRRVHRPDLLLVAALLHDIGKGLPGDHSAEGAEIAERLALRIGFAEAEAATVALLVRRHLLLVETATRRDLDDPATVRGVAHAVGARGTLELLHALTEADARATGPAAWSAWRAALVRDLVERTDAQLAGEPAPRPAAFRPTAEAERLAAEARRTDGPVLALRARREHPAHTADADGQEPEPEPVGVELLLAVPEQPGVLPCAAGVLALHRLTVRAADLRTVELPGELAADRRPVLLLTWRVAAEYGSLPQADRLRSDLRRALRGALDITARLAEREAAYGRKRKAPAPPPVVTVPCDGSELATVLEVRAQDTPGLLHRIGKGLEDAGVRVRSAHISTFGANAVDAFYLTDGRGAPLSDAAALAAALRETLARP